MTRDDTNPLFTRYRRHGASNVNRIAGEFVMQLELCDVQTFTKPDESTETEVLYRGTEPHIGEGWAEPYLAIYYRTTDGEALLLCDLPEMSGPKGLHLAREIAATFGCDLVDYSTTSRSYPDA